MEELLLLKGKTLGCWCKPEACHGDVLVELVTKYEAFIKKWNYFVIFIYLTTIMKRFFRNIYLSFLIS